MVVIQPEPSDAAPQIEALLDRAFGPGRHAKTAERLREGRLPADGLSFVAADAGMLVGIIRFWHVRIGGGVDALLLGPVAVADGHRQRGLGGALIRRGLAAAKRLAHGAVLLVGDEPYYRRFGFRADLTRRLALPGPVDRGRFLAFELAAGALESAGGVVRPAGLLDPARFRRAA
jgi:predicted N-acetyltransferase YhbS